MPLFDTEHWKELGRTYIDDFPRDNPAYAHQLSGLAGLLIENTDRANVGSIIEVGCGFGRVTADMRILYPDATIIATDVSDDMLKAAERYLVNSTNPSPAKGGVALSLWDLEVDEPIGPADLVVAAEVLMHRRPEQIAGDVAKLVAMAQRYLVMVDWYEPGVADTEGNYQHDYPTLVRDAAAAQARGSNGIMRGVPEARQAVWLFEFDRPIVKTETITNAAYLFLTPNRTR